MSVQKIAVIGGGTMGSGIALTAATHGIQAVMFDINDEQLARAKIVSRKTSCARSIQKERMTNEEGRCIGRSFLMFHQCKMLRRRLGS